MEAAVHVMLQWMGFKQEGLCCHSLLQLPKKKRHEAAVSAIKAWAVDVEFIAANILLTGSAAFVVFYHPSGVDKSMTLHLQRWFVEFRSHLCRLWRRAPKLYSVEVIQDGRTVSTIPGSHLCYPVYFVLSRLAGMLNGAIDMYYALCPADQMQLIITNSEQHSWRISKVATVDKLSSLENFDKPTVLW